MCLCLSSLRPTVRPHLIPYRSMAHRPRRSPLTDSRHTVSLLRPRTLMPGRTNLRSARARRQHLRSIRTGVRHTGPRCNPYGPVPPSYGQYAAPTATVPLDKPYYGCSFQEAFLRFWKKYTVFKGRASRSEFWWWVLAAFGINIVLDILNTATDEKLGFLATIWGLATLIPTLALSVRRLHDTNKPAGGLPFSISRWLSALSS